jgi:RNA polymerase sigma-70 factor (ECF subfamily)
MDKAESHFVCENLFRRQAGRIVSGLAGLLGSQHLQLAEDAVQESMLRAVRLWPLHGLPAQPEAWLFRVAHNYAISGLRRNRSFDANPDALIAKLEASAERVDDPDVERHLRDDELRLIFLCCHPDLHRDAQVALSLKLACGFSVGEIARLFLTEEATIAQRLVRAKRLLRERQSKLTMPTQIDLPARLDAVLEVIYLMFSGGYSAHSGEALIRRDVCAEAIRLGRLVAASSISVPRADALVALMALQSARSAARTSEAGDLILLEDQDRSLWDLALIDLGFEYFERSISGREISTWHVQAAIAATYAGAASTGFIDWPAVLGHYDELVSMTHSPVAALNRAVAVGKVHGAGAALEAIEPLRQEAALRKYYLLPAVRGRLLTELGRYAEAEAAFSAALQCECSEPEKRFLRGQLALVS